MRCETDKNEVKCDEGAEAQPQFQKAVKGNCPLNFINRLRENRNPVLHILPVRSYL